MTIESAASRPGAEPTAAKRPTQHDLFGATDEAMSGDRQGESEIWYPTAPTHIPWPRIFPSL
jgi:hypothetical protein